MIKIFKYWQKDKRKNEVYGVILVLVSLLTILALVPSPGGKNYIGAFGNILSKGLKAFFGIWGAYLIPITMVFWGWQKIERESRERFYIQVMGYLFLLASSSCFISLIKKDSFMAVARWGGYLGTGLAFILQKYFGTVGAYLIVGGGLAISILLTTEFSLMEFINNFKLWLKNYWSTRKRYRLAERKPGRQPKLWREPEELRLQPSHPVIVKNTPTPEKIKPTIITPLTTAKTEAAVDKKARPVFKSVAEFQLPPLSLLDDIEKQEETAKESELQANAQLLEQTLSNFGIEAQVVQIHPGPVITRYDVQPSLGVKVSKIVSLENDIALAMRAPSIRILAPIPGKAAVGIEIPNARTRVVTLKEILQSREFETAEGHLVLAIGKTVSGQTFIANLIEMPHLLIAGATGSGKSVCINTLVASILFRSTPKEVRFLMIDPKMIELPVYNGIPHLLTPVIINPRQAANALAHMIREMDRRYKIFAETRVRNIDSYNKLNPQEPLPYIIVVIDELADLMILSSVEVEDYLMRLAQMARGVGIHLIIATQRPSVDVITGVIKANFPSRIAFQVLSKTDSRIILDSGGAEDLMGRGDMLFLPPGAPKATRLQGALVSEKEIEKIVEFLSKQAQPEYSQEFTKSSQETSIKEEESDSRFLEAVRLVINTRQASISLLQRRLNIGYNHAGRIIDQMEARGIVGPPDGTKPREVLVDINYLNKLEEQKENAKEF